MKPYSFFYHYNKPLSKSLGRTVLSIHYKKQCHFVHDVVINVPTKSRQRKTQPHCVICGKGVLTIKDNVGFID